MKVSLIWMKMNTRRFVLPQRQLKTTWKWQVLHCDKSQWAFENMSFRRVFSSFLEWSQMSGVFYQSVIRRAGFFFMPLQNLQSPCKNIITSNTQWHALQTWKFFNMLTKAWYFPRSSFMLVWLSSTGVMPWTHMVLLDLLGFCLSL